MKFKDDRMTELFGHYSKETFKGFAAFHRDNPHIYEEFKLLAIEMRETGRKKYSSKMIINVLRWNIDIRTDTEEEFKINDRYQSLYGRLMIYHHEEYESFFELRIRTPGR